MNKQHIQLSPTDREYLEALMSKGEHKAKTYRRALSLLELDRGQTYTAVSKTVKMREISERHQNQDGTG